MELAHICYTLKLFQIYLQPCYAGVMAKIYPENTFRAFCTLKIIYESQFQFQTTGFNHWCEIKPVEG